jgi:hypothetical protein
MIFSASSAVLTSPGGVPKALVSSSHRSMRVSTTAYLYDRYWNPSGKAAAS